MASFVFEEITENIVLHQIPKALNVTLSDTVEEYISFSHPPSVTLLDSLVSFFS